MDTLEPILAEHPFFKDLNKAYLNLIVGCASNVKFEPESFIARHGEPANQFYLIRHGKVALEIFAPGHGVVTIETLGEGQIFGWSWIMPPYLWRLDARALQLTRAIALDGQCLRRKCEENHDLGYELLKRIMSIVTQRFESTRLQVLDLYGRND